MNESVDQDRVSFILSQGTLEKAYEVLILASTAAVMDKQVSVFCTFSGLNLLKKDLSGIQLSLVGRSDLPLKLDWGPRWLRSIDWMPWVPNLVWVLPGMTWGATWLFQQKLKSQNQLSLLALREVCLELGVTFTACQMTLDLLAFERTDLMPEVEFAGAATYFAQSPASQALFI